MFFRRMFTRKDTNPVEDSDNCPSSSTQQQRHVLSSTPRLARKNQQHLSSAGPHRPGSVLQLTPLWEYILRTRTLPDNVCPKEMFNEFLERLRDAEWQVRQHALRVLVDVLVVMGPKADAYMDPLVSQLVENLGHQAPTVRKGALDCLRVYLAETDMPETVLLQILDIGLNQKITNEPFGGRLTCGVMLSLPALVQSTLHTTKRNYILRTTIDMLVGKMAQVTHQEITLKVLTKIRELIGNREFSEYMSHGAFREFELLCSVYGVGENKELNSSTKSWRLMPTLQSESDPKSLNQTEGCWKFSDEEKILECQSSSAMQCNAPKEKVILETEIQINDDTLTMRILEEKEDSEAPDTYPSSAEDEVISGPPIETTGIIHVLSDSEVEEINRRAGDDYFVTPATPRTPKRVTFGGEIVKMRTPDSDATVVNEEPKTSTDSKTNLLSLEIFNDNTKPIPENSPSHCCKHSKQDSSDSAATTPVSPASPLRKPPENNQEKEVSPRSPFKRLTVSSVDTIVSPRGPHKEIEVLHNLQREPSPVMRSRRASIRLDDEEFTEKHERSEQKPVSKDPPQKPSPKSWEELDIVDDDVLMDLRSGDWRQRSNGIYALEDALRSSENLARVQPCLDSLLRTLLSSEKNPEVAEEKRRVLMNLISRLPLDNLEDRTVQIITGLCRQGGPGANRASKALMQRLPPAVIVLKLISDEFLHAKSSRFRENALQMVMYALMTFPSTCFDTNTCVTSAALAALDRKKRVRQAALDVLAILGQVTSPRVVLEVVQNIAAPRDNGNEFFAAVKARLSRKQLPLVSSDGTVQYTLRVPSPQSQERTSLMANIGSDLEWIASGVGSVSPTSLKRRAHKYRNQQSCCQSFNNYSLNSHEDTKTYRSPHEMLALGVEVNDNNTSDDNHSMANSNNNNNGIQYVLGKTLPLQYTSMKSIKNGGGGGTTSNNNGGGGEIIGINGKRIATKSCSDSSGDGRSSDSTYTTSSSGNNGLINLNGRFARQSVTSRFPTMERIDMTGNYLPKQTYKNPFLIHNTRNQVHLNSTYPKVNYTVQQQHRKHITRANNQRPSYYSTQDTFDESSFGEECHEFPTAYVGGGGGGPAGGATVEHNHYNNNHEATTNGNSRRFVNVEKFIQSNKTSLQSHSNGNSVAPSPINETPPVTPHITIPLALPTKPQIRQNTDNHHNGNIVENWSHAGIREYRSDEQSKNYHHQVIHTEQPCSTPITTVMATLQSSPNGVDLRSSVSEATKSEIVRKDQPETESSSGDVVIEPLSPEKDAPKVEPSPSNEPSEITTIEEKPTQSEGPAVDTVDTPDYESQVVTPTSRPQSAISTKSQVIEEELDCEQPPVEPDRVSEATQEVLEDISDYEDNIVAPKTPTEPISPYKTHSVDPNVRAQTPNMDVSHISPPRSPTIQEMKALSRKSSFAKSCDSLFDHTSSKLDADNSTETSSDYQSSHLNNTLTDFTPPVKPQHIPLQRKSKTSCFMKKHRRISPVKQTINMGQAELYPQNMTRFEKPRDALHKAFDQLDSSNWEINVMGLKSMVRLMRYHPDTLDNQMHMTCIQLTKSVRNLRSQVSRAACQASTELFTMKCKFLEQECDDLVCALLHRTADTNRFLRADATRGLESMCDNLTPSKVLSILCNKGANHQNAIVRTTTAKLLNRLADRIGCDKIYTMGRENRDKFILTGANLLLEGSLETRSYAKSLFRLMSSHQNYSRLLLEVIPTRTYRNIEKTLKNIR